MNWIDTEEKRIELGAQIRKVRRMKEISQEVLSELTNLSVQTIYRIENGHAAINHGRVQLIAAALGVNEEEITVVLNAMDGDGKEK